MSSDEPFDGLEAELTALGDLVDVPTPPPPDVAAAVRARLASDLPASADAPAVPEAPADPAQGPDPAHRPQPAPRRRRRWTIVAAVLAVVIAITAATPQGRAAVARILRFAGIELQLGDAPPAPVITTAPLPGEHSVPPGETAGQAGFPVKTLSALGPAQHVTVADGGRVVSMFWTDDIRLDQFDGGIDPVFFKRLGPPMPDYAKVGPYAAWWLPGTHPLGYISRQDGTQVPLRQAGPTLIWQQSGLNYRLEGMASKEEAIRVAGSLR
ncbi:hypothetical protein ABZ897_56500 [Nonomuraea sp. NPDC046802]|uniref:hypothetical protein n=1 Tax=Nonomuraea sp. NPDC046802 TaxID=3154919 RepID=UPI0034078E90